MLSTQTHICLLCRDELDKADARRAAGVVHLAWAQMMRSIQLGAHELSLAEATREV